MSLRPAGVLWRGNEDLRPLLVPIQSVDPDVDNARIHGEENLAMIRNSLHEFGQVEVLVGWRPTPDARPIIMAGNGRLQEMKALGWTHVAVSVYVGPKHRARALAIIANKSSDLATWNQELADFQMQECASAWAAEEPAPWQPDTPPATFADEPKAEPRERSAAAPDVEVEVISDHLNQGDQYVLGSHRLIVGDPTEALILIKFWERSTGKTRQRLC